MLMSDPPAAIFLSQSHGEPEGERLAIAGRIDVHAMPDGRREGDLLSAGDPHIGEVELRGLMPGKYDALDYAAGKDLGAVQVEDGKPVRMKTEFRDHLLLEVRPK